MREITEEWVFKAEDDYRSAEALLYLAEPPIVETACFHCQQCAEKYVKAFLEEHEIDFPRNHNLMQLLDSCIRLDESFETIRRALQSLEHYAVTVRYPGLWVPFDLGKNAYEVATRVRKFVRKKLKVR
jgi:HEPN domain-containing protein